MKHVKKIFLYAGLIIFDVTNCNQLHTKDTTSLTNPQSTSLPFKLSLSLDLIALEVDHYKDAFKGNWSNNIHAEVIIEEAEILVQTTEKKLQPTVKKQLIDLFLQHTGTAVEFTSNNKIVPATKQPDSVIITPDTDKHDEDDAMQEIDEKKKKTIQLKKAHKHKKVEAQQIFAPKKIHGARRTMKRLKKEAEERKKEQNEKIRQLITTKKNNLLKSKKTDLLQQEMIDRDKIAREYQELQKKMLEDFDYKNSNEEPFNENLTIKVAN